MTRRDPAVKTTKKSEGGTEMMTKRIPNNHYFAALVVLAMMAVMLLGASPAHASTTFTVNSASDFADVNVGDGMCDADFTAGNLCTLRAAINEANALVGEDTVHFNLPGTGVKTISPQTNLPNIINPVTINGFSQPGSSPNTLSKGTNAKLMIEINGSGVTGTSEPTGLRLGAPDSTVQGLVINRFITAAGGGAGVSVFGERVALQQNFIGTDPTGTQDLGNGLGVFHQGFGASIGGPFPTDANLISGNDGAGISARNLASNTQIAHNLIGTDKSGTRRLGNSAAGVEVFGSPGNDLENNTIAFNDGDGVSVELGGASATDVGANTIVSNSIFSNGGIGINLIDPGALVPVGESEGPTANDSGDRDSGPNQLQNKPVITSARAVGGKTIVDGTLNSHPDETYTVQFFSNPSGNEGKKFLGQKTVTTNGSGNTSFTFSATAVKVGDNITVTDTREFSLDTSEFSAPKTVKDATAPTVKSVVPAENATGVAPSANVSAFFSEAMRASTISATTVTLRKAGATKRVAATVSYDAAKKKATLNPKTNLQHEASYVATVTTGTQDLAGNALDQNASKAGDQPKIWRFKVRT
jgi:CSLREA domain-containing protein